MMTISTIAMMAVSMMVVTRLSNSNCLSFSLAMLSMVTISTIMGIPMVVITGFSFSLSLSMITMMTIAMMAVSMVVVSWLSNSFSLSLSLSMISMMTISTIAMMAISTIAMMAISMIVSWLSDSCTKDGKRNCYQKIHALIGLNSSETPPCTCVDTTASH